MMKGKKGAVQELQQMIGPIVGIAILLVVGFLILAQVKTQATTIEGASGYSVNATQTVTNAIATIPGWLPIIIVAVIGAVLLGLVAYFTRR